MKKQTFGFSMLGFILFFLTMAGSSSCTVMVFQAVNKASNGNLTQIIFAVLGNILVWTVICVSIDIVRRKLMVDKPTQKILVATSEIAKGNFDIKLDITHRHSKFDAYDIIMENINKMAEELGKNEVLKTDFVSNVSHEIKTPLSIIQNYSMLLQNNKLTKEERDKYLKEMVVATKRLSNLITNILKLNKLENQKLDFELEKFNLGEELRLCVLQFEELLEKKNITIDCDIEDIQVVSAKELLQLVWNNLLSNAIKFTENAGTISVNVYQEKKYAVVKVSDTGCGMTSDVGKHIFDKFYQGDTSRASDGNGLGLALVKRVIDILGGKIYVESELGKGSTFIVKLNKE